MSLFTTIKTWVYQRSLLKVSNFKRASKPMNLERAKFIGLLFDAKDLENRKVVLKYAEQLKKAGKSVHLLGYMKVADEQAQFNFNFFSDKDIDWANRPKGEQVNTFLADSYDLFINLDLRPNLVSDFIAVAAKATMKIGPVSDNLLAYDLMIDIDLNKKLTMFIHQFEGILQQTNVHVQAVQV